MAKTQLRSCSSCLYWQDYPTWKGYGVCDNPVSHSYNRGAPEGTAACEDFSRRSEESDLLCSACHYWLPSDYLSYLGECANPKATALKEAVWADKSAGACFAERSFEGLQFLWCQTCRTTISALDMSDHPTCKLFVGAAQMPVEDMAELTLAGD